MKMSLKKLIHWLKEGRLQYEISRGFTLYKLMKSNNVSDIDYLTKRYISSFGKKPNIASPQSFNEKLLWMKLYWRSDLARRCSDKVLVKEYIKECGLEEIVIPTLAVFNNPKQVHDIQLPDTWVMKTNSDSGGIFIKTRSTSKRDFDKGIKRVEGSLNKNYSNILKEWPYDKIDKKILIEKYIGEEQKELNDYKFFCFNGIPKYLFVASGRSKGNITFDFFDMQWNWINVKNAHKNSKIIHTKPPQFEKMIEICKIISKPFSQVRVDLYNVDGKIFLAR
jgi:hypothetical protein